MSDEIYSVEIIPIRFQEHEKKKRLVSCGKSKIIEKVNCELAGDGECPETCQNLGFNCGNQIVCGGTVNCGSCTGGDICISGSCTTPECTENDDCTGDEVCVGGVCQFCGNGVVDGEEQCDSVEGCSETCTALIGYSCEPSVNICASV